MIIQSPRVAKNNNNNIVGYLLLQYLPGSGLNMIILAIIAGRTITDLKFETLDQN